MIIFSDTDKNYVHLCGNDDLLLVDTDFEHPLTDLHLSKLIMRVLTLRDVSKFSGVNTANNIQLGAQQDQPCAESFPNPAVFSPSHLSLD